MAKLTFLFPLLCFFAFACQSQKEVKETNSNKIRINQIGFYPASVKQFAVIDLEVSRFDVINEKNKSVFSGELINNGNWKASGEKVLLGDFSTLKKPGNYKILLENETASYTFKISANIYEDALNAAIKSFYFQRASMEIEEKFGGEYKRGSGHPDDKCIFHPSTGKDGGSHNSPGGWYDAGDYGKYVGNASITVGQMLNLIEQYPEIIKDGTLNIPESGNGIGDLWDEIKYELDWILTMQDDDGGVFHKLTALNFGGFIMPEDYKLDRYIIGKGTISTLNFSAVLAQASRLYKNIDSEWSEKALIASKKAWNWAMENNNIGYRNPKDVSTGDYGNFSFDDDFYWAAAELYITTNDENYLEQLQKNDQKYQHQLTNSWKFFIRNMGFHSLLENRNNINKELGTTLTEAHIKLADEILNQISKNPYHVALERYEWGSNSDMLNQAMILCYAHRITGDEKYLIGAEQNTDYIFGKNATAYSFLTGFGSKQVMNPHHRPSGADGVENPVPGFIIGGPNPHQQDARSVKYESDFPAKSFVDAEGSFASNEVCLNWNAPAVFVLGYLQQVRK